MLEVSLCLALLGVAGCAKAPQPGTVLDEAMQAGRTGASFPHAADDYFHDMDGGIALSEQEIQGRNMWLVWSGGNDRFWDRMTQFSFGAFDLLKAVSSHPALGYSRKDRWDQLGLVNEPCFDAPAGPSKDRHGLWLDVRNAACAPDPFEDEKKYPGVAIGSRGKPLGDGTVQPVGSYYGYASGVLGLRLFPNPDFDAAAARRWDPQRYYTDPAYYNDKNLVRPYRVGISCGFCHLGPRPTHPPADREAPTYADLSSSVGAQYMWVDRLFIFNWNKPEGQKNFMYQLVRTFRPGSMDTSLVSTDNINNPRTMNAVYDFPSRMGLAHDLWHEHLAGGELDNKQFNDFVKTGPLADFWAPDTGTVRTPHVLKDGADSVGLLGALNRVYLNIGLFSEEWLLHFNPVIGGKAISPIPIATAQKNSAYWQATEAGTVNTALFFLKAAQPDRLADAPGGGKYLNADRKTLEHGKLVFADTCARCHSSKRPKPPPELALSPEKCDGATYLQCFHRYWDWTRTDGFKSQMRKIVQAPDFLANNFLSTDGRVPVTLLRTNICSPLATNGLAGNIWDNFTSHTYKALPSVGKVTLSDPFTAEPVVYPMPDGGRGYTRVPSLIGLWSTAPFLLNNTVGPFSSDPSVEGRLKIFDASIEQMLWPEKRDRDLVLHDKLPGTIDRTTGRTGLFLPSSYVPEGLQALQGGLHRLLPGLVDSGGDVTLGPIPKDMPVGLLANLRLRAESSDPLVQAQHAKDLGVALVKLQADLLALPSDASDADINRTYENLKKPLLALSKCPDFVVNRGHYFGTSEFNRQDGLTDDEKSFGQEPELSDDDRRALVAFLKTF
jgi:hypothetical protein